MKTLPELCAAAAAKWPDARALVFDDGGTVFTFAEVERRANQVANALRAHGVDHGDRVALAMGNHPLFPILWLGILKAGAVMVPINPSYRGADAGHLLRLAEPAIAFCDEERAAMLETAGAAMPVVTLAGSKALASLSIDRFLAGAGETPPPIPLHEEALTNIQFTSGTTGLPKGCMLTHRYWLELGHAIRRSVIELTPDDVMVTAQAFSYIDPQWALVLTLMSGSTLIVLDRFRPREFWKKIARYEATFFYCLAAMPLMLLRQPEDPDERNHKLRLVMCSAIPAERHVELEERFGVPWVEAFGTTETGADIGADPREHERLRGTGTIGRALPHREAAIVDEEDRLVARGETGELVIRGPGIMHGYWRDPAATAEALRNGWYHTGDMAWQDENGLFYLVGRIKDMIRRGGENIAAAEIEAVLQQHPAVALAACVAVADPVRGEEAKAFVVLKQNAQLEELALFLEERLAPFKVPRYWDVVAGLPMTASARVAKPKLSRSVAAPVYDRRPPSSLHQKGLTRGETLL